MKSKIILLLTTIIFIVSPVFSQSPYLKEAEKIADSHFDDTNYNLALKKYLEIIKEDENNVKWNYRIGLCYIQGSYQNKKAIPYFEKIAKSNYNDNINYFLALAYLNDYQFNKAVKLLDVFINTPDVEEEFIKKAKRLKEMCNNAIALMKTPVNVKFENLTDINSTKDDYNAFINGSENFIILSANKKFDAEYETYSTNIYTSIIGEDGKWTFPTPVKRINTFDNEEINFMSKNCKYLYIRNSFEDVYSDMLCGVKKGRAIKLDEENPLNKLIENGKYQYGMSTNEDNTIVCFGAKVDDNYDIYMLKKLPNGEWSDIDKLSNTINTDYDDVLPVISADGKTLYFASEGHNSMGGLDLFVSHFDKTKKAWSKPKNLGYPINTTDDDFVISFFNNNSNALISSIREGGKGGRDIYKITFPEIDPKMAVVKLNLQKGNREKHEALNQDLQIEVKVYDFSNNLHSSFTSNTSTGNAIIAIPPGKYKLKIDTFGDYPLQELDVDIKGGDEFQFKYDFNIYVK